MIVMFKSTPLPPTRFGSPILTIILDPRPSVDMVLPVVTGPANSLYAGINTEGF